MRIKKSQKKLSAYRSHMGIREGLSFSDYFDDSVPYEVKPTFVTTPTCEENDNADFVQPVDYPTRAKDLFKGLWEETGESRILASGGYWLTPECKFEDAYIGSNSHELWAKNYLKTHDIPLSHEGSAKALKDMGFVRILVQEGLMLIGYTLPPTDKQWDILIDSANKSGVTLIDQSANKIVKDKSKIPSNRIRHNPTALRENKGNRQLFIEGMMPEDMDTFKSHLAQLFSYLQNELKIKTVPKVKLLSDEKNANKILGKTAYYDPDTRTVNLYITDRHQKDILRSFAHEIVHHWQHENEKLQTSKSGRNIDKRGEDPQYAQHNPWLRQMEKQAYLLGNIMFRDWEDQKKAKDRKSSKKMVERTYLIGKEYPPKKMDYSG